MRQGRGLRTVSSFDEVEKRRKADRPELMRMIENVAADLVQRPWQQGRDLPLLPVLRQTHQAHRRRTGEPFNIFFNPDVQRLALRPEAEDESGTQAPSVVGLNDEHWVEMAGSPTRFPATHPELTQPGTRPG
ncbi:MAG: hypothetical protein L0H03_13235 [Rhodococcus sp. (in: high G+C Gram-positive bacteria)]|nr:hypothetical protein [Rhodococcus sp. (in: high G+C Gram-positive bacteria)]